MPQLPQELVDRFIDDLGSDRAALKTCGLVCREWAPRSRFHLFSEVKLQVGILRSRSAETFLCLVDTSSFDILAVIRRLSLSYADRDSLAKEHLLRFVPCSQLTDLSLDLPRDDALTDEILLSLHPQLALVGHNFSSLSSFSLNFGHLSLPGLLEVLACLPTLETLWIGGFDLEIGETPAAFALFPQRLHSLDMRIFRGAEHFFRHLISLPTTPLLRSLRLDTGKMENYSDAPVAVYLQRAGHALVSLDLKITRWSGSGPFERVALESCTTLRHLTLFLDDVWQPLTHPIDLLSAVASNELLTINLTLHTAKFDTQALDAVIARPRFRNLRSFLFYDGSESGTLFTPDVRARMPLASARGILQ
ncbi:hypothetical protein DFH09DRAFT_298370 [Mycena vulgaris]|nr:hypothetical protein DFH09DRAFT_298370 [Mycena vulgaris]